MSLHVNLALRPGSDVRVTIGLTDHIGGLGLLWWRGDGDAAIVASSHLIVGILKSGVGEGEDVLELALDLIEGILPFSLDLFLGLVEAIFTACLTTFADLWEACIYSS